MIKRILRAYRSGGFLEIFKRVARRLRVFWESKYYAIKFRNAPAYANPTSAELEKIELDLRAHGVIVEDFLVDVDGFQVFKRAYPFPENYHGGRDSGVWEEKLLEHYVAWYMLGIEHFQSGAIYIDVAACQSPWAKLLRDRGLAGGGTSCLMR
ncbi:MAG: hypothetical protein ACTTH5_00240 [Wolinella sp.]